MIERFYPIDRRVAKDKRRYETLVAVAAIVADLRSNGLYDPLGDARQSVLVVLKLKGADDVALELMALVEAGEDVGALITSSNWGKRKANKAAAKALSCQWTENKLCLQRTGCNCGG